MPLPSKKSIFLYIWFITLLIAPLTILRVTSPGSIDTGILITNFFQRLTGLTVFILLFWQLILGSFMPTLTDKLGGWIFKFHTAQGIYIYGLILIHPLTYLLLNIQKYGIFNPFNLFFPMAMDSNELIWISFGRFAFILLNLSVITAYFRTKTFLRNKWRAIHVLNYVAFIAMAIHTYFVGTDSWEPPFSYFYWISISIVGFAILRRIYIKLNFFHKELA